MSLEEALKEATVAVIALTKALGKTVKEAASDAESETKPSKKSSEPKEATESKKESKETKLTLDDVQDRVNTTIVNLAPSMGGEDKVKAKVRELIKEHGADKLAKLKPSNFKPFLDALELFVGEVLAGGGGDDDDDDM